MQQRLQHHAAAWIVVWAALWSMAGPPALAQERDGQAALDRIEAAFAKGDVAYLISQSATRLEVARFGESRLYSRSQAEYVLHDLFKQYPPSRFVFRDASKTERGWFAEGDFWYRRAERPVRVYVRLRLNGSRWELREILIQHQD